MNEDDMYEDERDYDEEPDSGDIECDSAPSGAFSEREPYSDRDGEFLIDGVGFADPGGNSALRVATRSNPRNLPCPTCKSPNRLTPADKRAGYQCDSCADRAEGGGWGHGEY